MQARSIRATRDAIAIAFALLAVVAWTAAPTAAAAPATCSAARLSPQLPKQQLPAKVAATRARIAAAAVRCDYAALARIAREHGGSFSFTFGASRSPAEYWRRLETQRLDTPLADLVRILRLPHTRSGANYAWPSAFRARPTAADWNALVRAGLSTRAEIARMKEAGGYLGYRAGISPKGAWLFFVAGD